MLLNLLRIGETEMKKLLISIGKALFYFLVYFAVQFAFILGYVILLMVIGKIDIMSGDVQKVQDQMQKYVMGNVVAVTVVTNTLTILAFLLITLIRKHKIKEAFYLNHVPARSVILIMILGIILNFTVSYGMDFFSRISPTFEKSMKNYQEYSSFMQDSSLLPLVILTVVSAPLTEEILLRCFIFTKLKNGMPQAIAVIITSITFGLLHGQILWAAYAAVLGSILNIVFIKYDSLYANLSMHFAFNAASFIVVPALYDVTTVVEGIILGICSVISVTFIILILTKKRTPKIL